MKDVTLKILLFQIVQNSFDEPSKIIFLEKFVKIIIQKVICPDPVYQDI